MHFKEILYKLYNDDEINIFVDMDGVITDYNFGNGLDFKNKRPIITNINTLSEISKSPHITLYILSICKLKTDIKDKNDWLDRYAPFFRKENRYIIAKEKYNHSSKELKLKALTYIIGEKKLTNVAIIDDDNEILKYISKSNLDIKLFQDSSIID